MKGMKRLITLTGCLCLLVLGACSPAPIASSAGTTGTPPVSALHETALPAAVQVSGDPQAAPDASGGAGNPGTPTLAAIQSLEQNASATAAATQSYLQFLQTRGYIEDADGAYYQIDGRTSSVDDPHERRTTIIEGFYPSNFVLRAETAWSKPDVRYWDKDYAGCGFAFHINTDGDYEVKIRMDGAVSFSRLENETQYSYQAFKIAQVPYRSQFMPEGSEILTLIVNGDEVTLLVNDREVMRASDDKLTSDAYRIGLLAFVIENSEGGDPYACTWSNVELWETDKPSGEATQEPAGTPIPTLVPDAESIYNVGIAQYQRGDYPSAITSFTRAIELEPDVYVSYYARAILYYVRGDYLNALKDLDRTIELMPDLAVAYYRRARVYEDMNDTEKAAQDFARAEELGFQE